MLVGVFAVRRVERVVIHSWCCRLSVVALPCFGRSNASYPAAYQRISVSSHGMQSSARTPIRMRSRIIQVVCKLVGKREEVEVFDDDLMKSDDNIHFRLL